MSLQDIAAQFGGVDPLKPAIREELDDTKKRLRSVQEQLRFLNMEVTLREPLEEEVDELRQWVKEQTGH